MRFWVVALVIAGIIAVVIILRNGESVDDTMFLTASDNKKIAYDLYEVKNPKGWLILTHMMPATKESWQDFAGEAQKLGYESITIDLRGHGESDGGPDGYQATDGLAAMLASH